MKRYIVSLFLMLVLTGCGQKDSDELVLIEPDYEVTKSPESALLVGQQAMKKFVPAATKRGSTERQGLETGKTGPDDPGCGKPCCSSTPEAATKTCLQKVATRLWTK